MLGLRFALCVFLLTVPAWASFRFRFDEAGRRWTLANSRVEAVFRLTPEGLFRFSSLKYLDSGDEWTGGPTASPIRFRVDDQWWDAETPFRLLWQYSEPIPRGGFRQTIHLEPAGSSAIVTIELELYENLPVLRYGVRFKNMLGRTVHVTAADMTPWTFDDLRRNYRALRIEQWFPVADPANFERLIGAVPREAPLIVDSGAHGRHCAWLALVDGRQRGLALGWEFDGRAQVTLRQNTDDRLLELTGAIESLHHPVDSGMTFQVPYAFLVPFRGNWDDAAFATQRFTEAALAKPMPEGVRFPFVSWDSWAYGQNLDEATLRRNAQIAARLGVELFVVDLGWARNIGDWRADPVKFPSGLKSLSDYVHSLGMKFGLHFAFAEANAMAPVLQRYPEWTSSQNNHYYGAQSLCLSHKPARDWIIAEALHIIDDYGVDWILQDGENMVKECRKTSHTHHPDDSNYANAVDGLGYILKEVQRLRPNVAWENCENGGNLMTFQMVQNYVTSIVNDASGALGSRLAVYGATYPFPPRYTDRYMPEDRLNSYVTRSYMFGGPWIFMNRLAEMSRQDLDYAASEITRYKSLRDLITHGKVLHLSPEPAPGRTDAIAAYHAETDSAVAVVTRDQAAAATFRLRIREFHSGASYQVSFADDPRVLTLTGAQLAEDGVSVRLPESQSAEIVHIRPLLQVEP